MGRSCDRPGARAVRRSGRAGARAAASGLHTGLSQARGGGCRTPGRCGCRGATAPLGHGRRAEVARAARRRPRHGGCRQPATPGLRTSSTTRCCRHGPSRAGLRGCGRWSGPCDGLHGRRRRHHRAKSARLALPGGRCHTVASYGGGARLGLGQGLLDLLDHAASSGAGPPKDLADPDNLLFGRKLRDRQQLSRQPAATCGSRQGRRCVFDRTRQGSCSRRRVSQPPTNSVEGPLGARKRAGWGQRGALSHDHLGIHVRPLAAGLATRHSRRDERGDQPWGGRLACTRATCPLSGRRLLDLCGLGPGRPGSRRQGHVAHRHDLETVAEQVRATGARGAGPAPPGTRLGARPIALGEAGQPLLTPIARPGQTLQPCEVGLAGQEDHVAAGLPVGRTVEARHGPRISDAKAGQEVRRQAQARAPLHPLHQSLGDPSTQRLPLLAIHVLLQRRSAALS